MNRTLISLAIIKSHWEKNKSDYIDNFIPFVAFLLFEKKYKAIDLDVFQKDFKDKYGLIIPRNALITIFNRARKKGVVKKENGEIYFNPEYSGKVISSNEKSNIERKFNKVISSIIEFARNEYDLIVNEQEVETGLLSFLRQHDLDILFATKDLSVLPQVKSTKKIKYLISSFSLYAAQKEPQLFEFLLDISVGHALSGTILYSELNSFSGKLTNLNIYLDTPLILGLLGFNGEFKKASIEELINALNSDGANLFILETTRWEVDHILEDSHTRLESGNYELDKASRVLRFCHREGVSASDLEQKILTLDDTLKEYKIKSASVPSHTDNIKYQIDEEELKKTIKKTYQNIIKDYNIDDYSKDKTIDRDVKVLSGIYRFRKGAKPKTIKDSKDIFITSNTALAFASRIFESRENGSNFTIPTCLTDVFLGTVIWLQSPQKIENLNTKRFIADCYSAIQPNTELITKYINEVEKLKAEKKITNDEYYLMRTHRASLNLLEKKTMSDPDALDGSSAREILDKIIYSIKENEQKKYEEEHDNHKKTQEQLKKIIENSETHKTNLKSKAEKISIILSRIIFVLLIIIIGFFLIINIFQEFFNPSPKVKIIIWIVIGILTLLNLATGFNILGFKMKLQEFITRKIIKWLEIDK
jgi:hypothetical protein